ncbi:MAG: RelA/SpoT family protein [Candidatus Gracilibacteria bacterium]|nr:RelA/SpoT family protein [Candidatus Gracilibacteria bacterium]
MERYINIDKKVEKIVLDVAKYMTNLNIEYIRSEIFKAYIYSRDAHEGQNRFSGDPYIIHPVEAVEILLSLRPDLYTIQACFLHDVIEDTIKTEEDIKKEFGDEVAFLCVGMEKLSKVKYKGEQRTIGSLRKMIIAMADDLRVIFIKLSDRLHNMRTLKYQPKPEKRQSIALETLNIYAPIADRLGLYHLKNALDEECFKILEPENYKKLYKELKILEPQIVLFTKNAKKEIEKLFNGNIENYEIDFRVKSIYSIHKKLVKKGLTYANELYDLFGIRIMVESESDCYKVLGIIHSKLTPLPKRFKDYIALPKPNGYKSLHTNVMGLFESHRKQPTEIQIKTYKMKEYSDIGVAAHFEYKESGSILSTEVDWVNELKELVSNIGDSDFVGSLKVDVFKDRIFIFTPKGDFINLPSGSTPIDFAYYVHSDLGDHISIAKVNNSVYPLDKELHNGDVVEIVIDKNKKPNPFRIGFVKTVKAKNRIKNYLKKEDKELHRERGKDMMNKYLEKAGMEQLDKDLSILKVIDGVVYPKEDRFSLLEQIGNFSVNPSAIIKRILKTKNINTTKKDRKQESNIEDSKTSILESGKNTLVIGGEENLPYKLGNCCKNKIGNEIVAHINGKGIITIHQRTCDVLKDVNKDRLLSAFIQGYEEEEVIVDVELIFKNKIGVLKELSDIIFSMGIDVDAINTTKISTEKTRVDLKLKIMDYDYMMIERFVDRLSIKFQDTLVSSKIGNTKKEKK